MNRLIKLFVATQVLIATAAVIGVLGLGYVGYLGVQHVRAARELDIAKTAMVSEATGFCDEADRRVLEGWAKVGESYLSQRDLGRLDEMMRMDPEKDFWKRNNVVLTVREAIRDHFRQSLRRYIDREELETLEPRLKLLYNAAETKHQVYLCGSTASHVESMEALDALQEDFETKKKELAGLLRLVSTM